MNPRFTPVAAAMMAAFAAPVLFQQPVFAQTARSTTSLPEVVVRDSASDEDYAPSRSSIGGAVPSLIRDIPQSVTVINRAVLEAQAASTMTEALRNVPGITISAGEGGNIGDNINLRGFSARTDIFMDGFRDLGQYTRDTFNVEAVEVLKGPSSMLFGRGSTGGVINQVSKKPGLKPISEVTVGVGTDDYYRTTVDLNRAISDTSAFRVNAFGQSLHSTRDVVENKDWGIAPSLRFGIGTPTEVTLSGLFQRNDDTPDYGFPLVTTNGAGTVRKPVDAPADRFFGYTDDRFEQEVNVLNATVRHKISPTLTLRNQTQVADYTTDASPSPLGTVTRIGGGTPSLNDPLNLLVAPRQDRDRTVRQKSFFNQTDLTAKLQAGPILHTVTTGIEFGRDEYHEDRYVWNTANADRDINLGNPVNGTRQGARALTRTVNTTADTLAAFINDQVDLNKQWKLVGGVRWERFKASSTLQTFPLPAATPAFPADTTQPSVPNSDTMFNVRAGVIYQPTEAQSYYLSYGTSSNPSAEAVTQSATTAALDPEKNRSIEAGAKLDFLNGNLSFNTAVFRVEKTNARTTDRNTGITSLDGNVRVQGLELGVVGRITPAWQVMAGYTYLDGKVVKSLDTGTGADAGIGAQGKTLQNTPRHSASVWSTYSFAGNWEAGGGLVYSSDRFVNNLESAMIDGYTRIDATLAYRQPKYDVRLSLQNLTDKKYFESASGGRATPVKGRTAIVTMAYRF